MGMADPGELAGAFEADGAVVVRGVVPPEVLAAAREAVDALGADELADLSALAAAEEAPRFRAGVDHWRRHRSFADLAAGPEVVDAVAALLRTGGLWLYEDSVLVKDPGATVPTRWHTDDGYFHVEGDQLATVWIPLDPAPLDAGALRFVRGSHRHPVRYRPTLFVTDDPIPGTRGERPPDAPDPSTVVGWDLEPGDLTVHHARTLHAAGGNATSVPRRALSIRYCGDDAIVRIKPGAPAKSGFESVAPGTPLREAAARLGLPEVRRP